MLPIAKHISITNHVAGSPHTLGDLSLSLFEIGLNVRAATKHKHKSDISEAFDK